MKIRLVFAIIGVSLLLSACGLSILPTADISAGFTPTALGFEVDDEGKITVAAHSVVFTARKGSIGATVTGYRIEFFNKDGNPLIANDNVINGWGALNADVPAGFMCDERLADATYRCTVNNTNVRYMPMNSAPVNNFVSLDAPFVDAILNLYQVGDYANVYFNVTDDLNRTFEVGPLQVPLAFPVSGG